jgi:hypothetical protein
MRTIDLPMYEWLLNADRVAADLSSYNANGVFEIGVRKRRKSPAAVDFFASRSSVP